MVAVTAGIVLSLVPGQIAGASATAGQAVITRPGQNTPLDSGGSSTLYGLALPENARCSGDTEHDQYHVFSFMFPESVAPTDVSFKTGEPAGLGTEGHLGFISGGQYVGPLNTAPTTGQVVGLPGSYTWTRLTRKYLLLSDGKTKTAWNGGIACANKYGVVTNYWTTQIIFTASKTDPLGFTWSVPKSSQAAVAGSHSFPIGIVLLLIAAALAVIAIVMSRRRKSVGDNVVR